MILPILKSINMGDAMDNKKSNAIHAILAVLMFTMCWEGYLHSQDRYTDVEKEPTK